MKTVSEFAKEKNVSVQTIYRKLNNAKHVNGESLTEKKNGITYITVHGVTYLSDSFAGVKHSDINMFNSVKHAESKEVSYLREQNRILQDELGKEREHSRAQADRLSDLAEQLAELSRNNQILLGAEQRRANPALTDRKAPGQSDSFIKEINDDDYGHDYYSPRNITKIEKKSIWHLFRKNRKKG